MADQGGVIREAGRAEWSNFHLPNGLRAGVITVAPLVLGVAVGNLSFVYSTLAAMLVTNAEGPNSTPLPIRFLILACIAEPIGFALGTAVALAGPLTIPLMGLGVCIGMLAGDSLAVAQVGRFTAIFFAVGVGLPGATEGAIETRLAFAFGGALLALAGAWTHRALTHPDKKKSETFWLSGPTRPGLAQLWPTKLSLKEHIFRWGVAVGIASSLGLAIGLALGLPRDFWIVVTLIIATRPRLGPTVSMTLTIVVGTIIGAVMAAAVVVGIGEIEVLEVLLLLFGTMMFATRGVNLGLIQVFFTPFIIILLNILYPGSTYLAEYRILDVGIGGLLAIVTVYTLSVVEKGRPRRLSHHTV